MQIMQCSFKARLESMVAGPRKNQIVAECGHGDTYYLYVETMFLDWPWAFHWTFINGPQWTALCDTYAIELDDVVAFTYDEADHLFYVEVTDTNNVNKHWVHNSGMLISVIFLHYTLSSL